MRRVLRGYIGKLGAEDAVIVEASAGAFFWVDLKREEKALVLSKKHGEEAMAAYEVKLLITGRGITPLSALAFLADVADIGRFRTLRKMNAYLGLVQKVSESAGKSKPGKARVALIRNVCGIMRRMLLNGEPCRWMKKDNRRFPQRRSAALVTEGRRQASPTHRPDIFVP